MNTEKMMVDVVDPNTKWLFRAGGISAIVLGISYIIITALYALGGALPSGAEECLKYLAGHTTAWWTILGLSVLTDFLFALVALPLYLALKEVNKNAMLVGTGLLGLFAILDLAVTWPNYSSLITLSGNYATATSDVQRAVFVAAASYASAVLAFEVSVYAILVPSLGILIIGLVMLKGTFSKVTAYSGVGSGILGIVSVVGPFFMSALGVVAVFSSVLTTVWVLLLGYRLYRLGQH